MKVMWNIGRRQKGDSRYTLVRVEFGDYVRAAGWKLSISVQPRLWLWRKGWRDLRVTFLGTSLHYKRA